MPTLVIALIGLLFMNACSRFIDDCVDLTKNRFATPFSSKLRKDTPITSKVSFEQNTLVQEGPKFFIYKKIKASEASESLFLGLDNVNENFSEYQMLECQYDGAYYYAKKSVIGRADLCTILPEVPEPVEGQEIDPQITLNQNRQIVGKFSNVPSYWKKWKLLGKGGFGEVRAFDAGGLNMAMKQSTRAGVPVQEILIAKLYGETNYGNSFHGCFALGNKQYMAVGRLPYSLKDPLFLNPFRKEMPSARMLFFWKLANSIVEFEKIGFAHNDIKIDNIMLDDNKDPHLLDYGCSRPLGGFDLLCGTAIYTPIRRKREQKGNSLNDVFSMAMTIAAIEHTTGEELLCILQSKVNACQLKVWPPEKANEEIYTKHMHYVVIEAFEKKWGPYDPNQLKTKEMNFTTFMMSIIKDANSLVTPQFFADWLYNYHFDLVQKESLEKKKKRKYNEWLAI